MSKHTAQTKLSPVMTILDIYLELGVVPVRFVIMQKRLQFLKYIINEDTDSMIKQESRKGDFVDQVKSDMKEMGIEK